MIESSESRLLLFIYSLFPIDVISSIISTIHFHSIYMHLHYHIMDGVVHIYASTNTYGQWTMDIKMYKRTWMHNAQCSSHIATYTLDVYVDVDVDVDV